MAEAITKGNEAINKLVFSGEIEELRDVVGPPDSVDDAEEYLQDDGEIDYSKVPDIDLPPPLPSSKFAQNPELLKTLNRGGKRKFDQLIGWSDGGANDRISKIHQPVFGGMMTDDSQSSDTDLRFGKPNALSADSNSFHGQDEDHHRRGGSHSGVDSMSNRDEDLRFNLTAGLGRPGVSHSEYERNSFTDKDLRFPPKKSLDNDIYDDRDRDSIGRWDDEKGSDGLQRKPSDGGLFGGNGFDKRDNLSAMGGPGMHHMVGSLPHGMPNHHNMQNINPNMPPPLTSLVPHPGMSQHPGMQGKPPPHPGMPGLPDGPMPPHMIPHHPNMHPGFGPNFRPPPNGNFGPNHFRPSPLPPFGPNQGPPPPPFGNGFQGPPNFRGPNGGPLNFDRPGFGPNFRSQNPPSQLTNFNSNYGKYAGKNGPSRGMSRGNGGGSDKGRSGYNNRGRGRDNDQSRNARGRDNY